MQIHSEEIIVIKNGIYIYILNFFATVFPLFTIPYVTRILGASGYGKFSDAFTLVNYFLVLVEYGFSAYGARKIAVSNSSSDLNACFSKIFQSRVFLCLCSILIAFAYVYFFKVDKNTIMCITVLFLMVLGSMFQQNWLLQGLQKMQFITLISIASRIISVVFIFMFVKEVQDVYLYCLFYALTNFLIGFFGFIIALKVFKVKLVVVRFRDIIDELKNAFYTFLTSLSGRVMVSFGITVLSLTYGQSQVGIYSAINKIPNVIIFMFSPISQAIYPYISKKFHVSFVNGLRYVGRIAIPIMILFIIVSIIMAFFSKSIVMFAFGSEYVKYHQLLSIFMIWVNFSILNNFLGIQTLLASNNSKYYGISFFVTAIVSVIINLLLINRTGIYGAAISLLIAEAFLSLLLVLQVVKILKIDRSTESN